MENIDEIKKKVEKMTNSFNTDDFTAKISSFKDQLEPMMAVFKDKQEKFKNIKAKNIKYKGINSVVGLTGYNMVTITFMSPDLTNQYYESIKDEVVTEVKKNFWEKIKNLF